MPCRVFILRVLWFLVSIKILICQNYFIHSYFWIGNQTCWLVTVFQYVCIRYVSMYVIGGDVRIEKLMVGDGTMCCIVLSVVLDLCNLIVWLMYVEFMVLCICGQRDVCIVGGCPKAWVYFICYVWFVMFLVVSDFLPYYYYYYHHAMC